MRHEDFIPELCKLVSEVGAQVFENEYAHDCFCAPYMENAIVEKPVLDFIKDAVREKMERTKKEKENAPDSRVAQEAAGVC